MNLSLNYVKIKGTFYDELTDPKKVGRFRSWLHNARYQELSNSVKRYYRKGNVVLDLACGSCNWNSDKIPVIGVDINENLLNFGLKNGRLSKKIVADIYRIPLKSNFADIVIMSEILEHVSEIDKVLAESKRVLKIGGKLITSVPYDSFPSPHLALFTIHCLIKGYIFGDPYYKKFCGHINRFSMRKIRSILANHFKIIEQFPEHMLHIFTIAEKVT